MHGGKGEGDRSLEAHAGYSYSRAERSVLGIHIQPVGVNSWRTGSLGRSTHLALSPKPEVFIQDHPRLITLKDLKEGELVVSEPTERRLGDQ